MRVKKYVAASMPEAMKQIRAELGADAVILNSKKIQVGGFLGLFKKDRIEVVAGLDPSPLEQKHKSQEKPNFVQEKVEGPAKKMDRADESIMQELKEMKQLIARQNNHLNSDLPTNYQLVRNYLIEQDVNENLADELIMTVKERETKEEITPSYIALAVKQEIVQRLKGNSFTDIHERSKIIHFIGPTGVGKTTTLAKIAAKLMLERNKKIAFITMDTYRIAAIDQLKTYAQILGVEVKVAYNYEEYEQALQYYSEYDHILVDTAGRNYRDDEHLSNIAKVIESNYSYLVLSLTAKPKDMSDIYERFKQLNINQIIFTKVDETTQYGSMLNIILQNDVDVSYATNGQNVPSDIIQLSPETIGNLIMDGFTYE